MKESADAIIIGGGVIGSSIAYHLAKRKFGRIVLLERESLAFGSTGRSVASIDLLTLQADAAELYARSATFFHHCDEILGSDCGIVETGSIVMAGPEQEDELMAAVQHMRTAGVVVEALSPQSLALLEPLADIRGVSAASYAPRGGYADPVLTTQALASAARRSGVSILQGQAVSRLRHQEGRISGVETKSGDIDSPVVILAAGAWSQELLNNLDITISLQPVRHPVVCIRRPVDLGPAHHSILDLTTGIYARPERDGMTLLGSINPQVGYEPTEPGYGDSHISNDYILWAMERLVNRYPALVESKVCKGWSGIMSISPDWQPIIGDFTDTASLFCAIGFSGRGFQISPATGDLLAGLICEEEEAMKLLTPFTPARFADDRLIQSGNMVKEYGLLG